MRCCTGGRACFDPERRVLHEVIEADGGDFSLKSFGSVHLSVHDVDEARLLLLIVIGCRYLLKNRNSVFLLKGCNDSSKQQRTD